MLSTILAWQPHDFGALAASGEADVDEKADFTRLQSALSGEPAAAADPNTVANWRLSLALWRRDYRAAEKALSEYRRPEMRGRRFRHPARILRGSHRQRTR